MKSLFALSLVLVAVTLVGADLTTKSGEVYRDFSVLKVTYRGVVISSMDGLVEIPYTDLPDGFREKYVGELERIAKQKEDAALDRQRGGNAEPVAAVRDKLQKAKNTEKPITVYGKDGRRYENCRIQRIGARGLTLKINGMSVYIPFRWVRNLLDGVLTVPLFAGHSLSEEHISSNFQEERVPPTFSEPIHSSRVTAEPIAPTTYTGPRGGNYYYNKNGRKTYVRKR